jgi:hypothetical protein
MVGQGSPNHRGKGMDVQLEAHHEEGSTTALADGETRSNAFARLRASLLEWNRANGVVPFGARPYAPAVVWLGAMAIAAPLAPYSQPAAAAVAAIGAAVAVTALRASLAARALTGLAMLPGAAAAAPAWTWVLAGGAVALLVSARDGHVVLRSHDLQRHLDWCRRRQEDAHVLVMRFDLSEVARPIRILESFRTTDSIAVHYIKGACELTAVLDDTGFSREGLERRITDSSDARFRFGWASFPAQGVTLEALIDTARAQLEELDGIEYQLPELAESYA